MSYQDEMISEGGKLWMELPESGICLIGCAETMCNNPSAIEDDPTGQFVRWFWGCFAPFFTGAIASSNPANVDLLAQYLSNQHLGDSF